MIIDSFLFNDELDLLEARLDYLSPFVDFYYLCESRVDHVGNEKPLHFKENENRFSRFSSKLKYVNVSIDLNQQADENVFGLNEISSKIESISRTTLGKEIKLNHPDSTLIYSDLDEIVDIKILKNLKCNKLMAVEQKLYYYYSNYECVTFPYARLPWALIVPTRLIDEKHSLTHYRNIIFQLQARYLGHALNQSNRSLANQNRYFNEEILPSLENEFNLDIIKDGGCHFSYFGGIDSIIRKLKQSSHSELLNDNLLDQDYIKLCIKNGDDIFKRGIKFNLEANTSHLLSPLMSKFIYDPNLL